MKKLMSLLVATCLIVTPTLSHAAPVASVPLYQVTVVQSSAQAINYQYLKSSTMIDFKGTVLASGAKGSAEVKSKEGNTDIDAEFENLPPASQFGPEYLTYVLWAISPEGRATNLGELILDDGKSELTVTEQLQAFGLLVTAEPYFAVSQPSNVVVLENAIRSDTKGKLEVVDAKYELLQRGQYATNISASAPPMEMDKKTPLAVYEARNAVRIALDAGAETYAPEAIHNAQQLLAQSELKKGGKKARESTAREAVERAEDARLVSVKRQEAASVQQTQDQLTAAKVETATAVQGQAVAEAGKAQAEQDKTQLRAQLLAQLNSILQTRDTARGLIVNMSGVLFATGQYELLPPGREKLAKISGIVLAHPGLKLQIEGHTDSVGGDALNQTLSEKRAQAASDYLVSQGLSADSIVVRGLGKDNPIATNDTAEGRQSNRRVELIVTGTGINDVPAVAPAAAATTDTPTAPVQPY